MKQDYQSSRWLQKAVLHAFADRRRLMDIAMTTRDSIYTAASACIFGTGAVPKYESCSCAEHGLAGRKAAAVLRVYLRPYSMCRGALSSRISAAVARVLTKMATSRLCCAQSCMLYSLIYKKLRRLLIRIRCLLIKR